MRSTSTTPMPAAIPPRWTSSSPSATCARSRAIRSPAAPRRGSRCPLQIRKRAVCSTSTAPRKVMSAGRQKGFTYVGFLIFVGITGAGLAAFGEIASHAAQREKEAELLFRGNQYRDGIASYYKKEQRYPQSL